MLVTIIIELSSGLSSQAYCLKVKEMDDEEYEAAVSLRMILYTCIWLLDVSHMLLVIHKYAFRIDSDKAVCLPHIVSI